MIKLENHLGTIEISKEYFVNLVGNAVVSCFGVAAMAEVPPKNKIFSFIEKRNELDTLDKGIKIRMRNDKLIIDLHIIVSYGTNISAIVKSIMHKVEFTVEEKTGFCVSRVNVFVDDMKLDPR